MTVVPWHDYTFAEYLALERNAETRHEYLDGEIFAMAGGTVRHSILGVRVSTQLALQLLGRDCAVCSPDLRIRVQATGLATYADVTVICGAPQLDPEDKEETVINPTVLVEVTSPSSERRDRGAKLEHYKQIPSLRAVVIVSHRERLVEVHEHVLDLDGVPCDIWTTTAVTAGTVVQMSLSNDEVEVELDVDELYDGTGL